MKKVFIDGSAGTTGLRIYRRLSERKDIELITLPEERRKAVSAREEALNTADIAFLCLPDAAAIEAVSLIKNDRTVVIDTSTAHRTDPGWAYGFPELGAEFRDKISNSRRIAVPGCHASGFVALVRPLVKAGLISPARELCCHSVTGYSGGGKKMIEQYTSPERDALLCAPRQYALTQQHKHLPEMTRIAELETTPVFCPIVADFYSGMEVTVPIFAHWLRGGKTVDDIAALYKEQYNGEIVRYQADDENGFLSAAAYAEKDFMRIGVFGNDDRILLTARYDNLGKGASGAAVQCLNIKLGIDEKTGLDL